MGKESEIRATEIKNIFPDRLLPAISISLLKKYNNFKVKVKVLIFFVYFIFDVFIRSVQLITTNIHTINMSGRVLVCSECELRLPRRLFSVYVVYTKLISKTQRFLFYPLANKILFGCSIRASHLLDPKLHILLFLVPTLYYFNIS